MADESYWTWKRATPTPKTPPPELKHWTDREWRSLSPGMRREIEHSYAQKRKVLR